MTVKTLPRGDSSGQGQLMDVRKLETKRLILSGWSVRKDAADLFEYARGPNVGPNAGWEPHESIRDSKRRIREMFIPGGAWKIVLKDEGKAIGSIELSEDIRRPDIKSRELGYSLSEAYWGRGIMTEAGEAVLRYAFTEMCLEVVSVVTRPENLRSRRVIEKLGFRYEGTLRDAYRFYDGTVMDTMCFSILNREWMAAHPREADGSRP